ncbi:MAG: response regulator [Gemmatimonadota bacterium]
MAQPLPAVVRDALQRMAGGVAHAFNDLVTAISANAQLLEDPTLSAVERGEIVTSLTEAVARMERLLERLQTVSRSGTQLAAPFDLAAAVRDTAADWRVQLGDHVTLEVRTPDTTVPILGERAAVLDAVTDLLLNARQAMPFGGLVTVEVTPCRATGDDVMRWQLAGELEGAELRVSDTGVGVDPADASHLFEPFATKAGTGGIGLAVVAAVARQHGGGVLVEPSVTGGTAVRIFLPLASNAPATVRLIAEPEVPPTGAETILVVDDDDAVRSVIVRALRRAGYTVFAVTGPGEALALADAHRGGIDLLLTDVAMPDMDGPELARRLQLMRPGLEVLPMSGFAPDKTASRWKHADHVRLLRKPFTASRLLEAVREALDTAR